MRKSKIQILEELPAGTEVNALGFPKQAEQSEPAAETTETPDEDAPVTFGEMLGEYQRVKPKTSGLWVKPMKLRQEIEMLAIVDLHAGDTALKQNAMSAVEIAALVLYIREPDESFRNATPDEILDRLDGVAQMQAIVNRYVGAGKKKADE